MKRFGSENASKRRFRSVEQRLRTEKLVVCLEFEASMLTRSEGGRQLLLTWKEPDSGVGPPGQAGPSLDASEQISRLARPG